MEGKSEWFCGVKLFRSNFKVEWEYGVWTKIRLIGGGFLFTCGNFTLIFTVFSIFGSDFLNGFSNPFVVLSRSSFVFSQWKFFELYVRTCPAMFFFISSSWFLLRPYDVTATFCSFVHAISTELHVWRHFSLLVERVFCSFAWLNFWSHLTYLTLKNDFLTLKLTFIYFNSEIRSNGCVSL